jgi:DNA segregation ATPase FtsK/SpoIIIE-like protein
MPDKEEEVKTEGAVGGVKIKDFLRQLQTLSVEEKELVTEALCTRPDVKPKSSSSLPPPSPQGGQIGVGQPQQIIYSPKLGFFSGDDSKGDISFEQWKYEVLSLQREGLSEGTIQQCIRRSIRGTAAGVVHNLGEISTVQDILDKLDQIFGIVLPPENILETFYSARQLKTESVANWACRIESIVAQIRPRTTRDLEESRLRSKFFAGLFKTTVKTAVRHKYDQGAAYKDLLIAARVAELEEPEVVHVQQSVASSDAKKFDELMTVIEKLTNRLDKLEKQTSKEEPQTKQQQQQQQHRSQQRGSQQQHPQQQYPQQPQQQYPQQQYSQTPQGNQNTFNGNCYACGGYGHRRYECPGNYYQPASWDRS